MRLPYKVIPVEPVFQTGNSDCGKACAEMVLSYFNIKHRGLESLANALDGVQVRTLESFFREKGMLVIAGNFNTKHLKYLTENKIPVICLLNDHYVLARGIADYRVHYNCPIKGEQIDPLTRFNKKWRTTIEGDVLYCWGIAAWKS
jgi:ABC-type bacteriocin/lantibiotic exporter with double-glycine peptidase domain